MGPIFRSGSENLRALDILPRTPDMGPTRTGPGESFTRGQSRSEPFMAVSFTSWTVQSLNHSCLKRISLPSGMILATAALTERSGQRVQTLCPSIGVSCIWDTGLFGGREKYP